MIADSTMGLQEHLFHFCAFVLLTSWTYVVRPLLFAGGMYLEAHVGPILTLPYMTYRLNAGTTLADVWPVEQSLDPCKAHCATLLVGALGAALLGSGTNMGVLKGGGWKGQAGKSTRRTTYAVAIADVAFGVGCAFTALASTNADVDSRSRLLPGPLSRVTIRTTVPLALLLLHGGRIAAAASRRLLSDNKDVAVASSPAEAEGSRGGRTGGDRAGEAAQDGRRKKRQKKDKSAGGRRQPKLPTNVAAFGACLARSAVLICLHMALFLSHRPGTKLVRSPSRRLRCTRILHFFWTLLVRPQASHAALPGSRHNRFHARANSE